MPTNIWKDWKAKLESVYAFTKSATITLRNACFLQWTHFSNLSKYLGLKKYILTVLLSHDLVNDASNNTPAIVEGQIYLGSEFGWFELLSTKNNMPWGIFHIESGNVTKLQNVWSCQKSLNSPPEIKQKQTQINLPLRFHDKKVRLSDRAKVKPEVVVFSQENRRSEFPIYWEFWSEKK